MKLSLLFCIFFHFVISARSEERMLDRDIIPFDVNSLEIKNLGPPVNTKYRDYGCNISYDYKFLVFISDRKGSMENSGGFSHDLWMSDISFEEDNYKFSDPKNLRNINTDYNEGAFCYTDSNIYVTFCNRPDALGSCDIYKLLKSNDKFIIENVGPPINTSGFESFPSVSRDESVIFYSFQARNSEWGTQDIAYSFAHKNGQWTYPKLIDINTEGNELCPCILSDKSTLVFVSDYIKPNYGGKDLYVTRFDKNEWKWTKPQNLGPKINTKWDELSPSMNLNGNILFFASERKDIKGYKGELDIYMVELPIPLIQE